MLDLCIDEFHAGKPHTLLTTLGADVLVNTIGLPSTSSVTMSLLTSEF